jgi:ribosomal protein L37AE/L43A
MQTLIEKNKTPKCPRCKTNANIIQLTIGWRCVFCGTTIYGDGGQQKLNL